MRWKEDAFQHQWDNLNIYTFPLFGLLRQVLSRVMLSCNLSMILVAPFGPQKEWFANLMVEEPLKLPTGAATCKKVSQETGVDVSTFLKTFKY